MDTSRGTLEIRLFDSSSGTVTSLGLDDADLSHLKKHQLLWIDLEGDDAGITDVVQRLNIAPSASQAFCDRGGMPELQVNGGFFIRVVAVHSLGGLTFNGTVLAILTGPNYVITRHAETVAFLSQLREREADDAGLGRLSADSFTASLLDWHLNTYFEAVTAFEAADDRLETEILDDRHAQCLESLRDLRAAASRLRRMLSAHRPVFAAIARPDFRPEADGEVNRHFQTVEAHFQRAMDAVESTRDVVIGSFELFSNQTALRTNAVMRVLTILTALMGGLAVVAGVLGMNFKAPFFDTGLKGFVAAIVLMVLLTAIGLTLARWRRWM